jgi:hypothetical protein
VLDELDHKGEGLVTFATIIWVLLLTTSLWKQRRRKTMELPPEPTTRGHGPDEDQPVGAEEAKTTAPVDVFAGYRISSIMSGLATTAGRTMAVAYGRLEGLASIINGTLPTTPLTSLHVTAVSRYITEIVKLGLG